MAEATVKKTDELCFKVNKEITNKLNKFKFLYGSKWDTLIQQKLNKFQANKSGNVGVTRDIITRLRLDLHLDCNSNVDSGEQDVNRDDGDEKSL